MKNSIVAGIFAAGFALAGAPAAHAATTAETTQDDSTPTVSLYSAMTDILSCTYYPTRPWCPGSVSAAS